MDRALALGITVLAVAILVILASIQDKDGDGFQGHEDVSFKTHVGGNSSSGYTITVIHVDTESYWSLRPIVLDYFLLTDTYQTIESGQLDDRNTSALNETIHFYFDDNDHDGQLSVGDQMFILGTDDGGLVYPGCYLRVSQGWNERTCYQIELQ